MHGGSIRAGSSPTNAAQPSARPRLSQPHSSHSSLPATSHIQSAAAPVGKGHAGWGGGRVTSAGAGASVAPRGARGEVGRGSSGSCPRALRGSPRDPPPSAAPPSRPLARSPARSLPPSRESRRPAGSRPRDAPRVLRCGVPRCARRDRSEGQRPGQRLACLWAFAGVRCEPRSWTHFVVPDFEDDHLARPRRVRRLRECGQRDEPDCRGREPEAEEEERNQWAGGARALVRKGRLGEPVGGSSDCAGCRMPMYVPPQEVARMYPESRNERLLGVNPSFGGRDAPAKTRGRAVASRHCGGVRQSGRPDIGRAATFA